MEKKSHYGLLLALLAIPMLGGCGIKPSSLEPPQGSDTNEFPRTYPTVE